MDENEQGQTLAANFPRPPPFYKYFSPENLASLQEIRTKSAPSDRTSDSLLDFAQALRPQDVPPELQYLIPPEPPKSGLYKSFGEDRNLNESLPALPLSIEQLFPSSLDEADRAHQLLKLAKSLLLNYLEFVGVLAANPELARPKIDDLRTLFFNAHQLINEYRPHQARESLISMMEQRVAEKRAEVEDVKRMRETVDKLLSEIGDLNPEDESTAPKFSQDPGQKDSESTSGLQKRVWKALNEIET